MLRSIAVIPALVALVACGTPASNPSAAPNKPGTGLNSGDPRAPAGPGTAGAGGPGIIEPADNANSATPALRLVGRFDTQNPNDIAFCWPNSAIGARFTGTELAVALNEPEGVDWLGKRMGNFYNVVIDDQPPVVLQPDANQLIYPVAQGLDPTTAHTVWLTKRTDARVGNGSFAGFRLGADGQLLAPPAALARRIEVIGASGTAGYGVERSETWRAMCHFSPDTENAEVAYPRLVATALNAELINLSYQGKGVLRNYSVVDKRTVPVLYARVLPSRDDLLWDFTQWTPDVVVIQLGANDFAGGTPNQTDFVAAWTTFLKLIRHQYSNAPIVVATGPSYGHNEPESVTMANYLGAAVRALNDQGDTNVSLLIFDEYLGETFGCDYHPDRALQQLMADQLTAYLQQLLRW